MERHSRLAGWVKAAALEGYSVMHKNRAAPTHFPGACEGRGGDHPHGRLLHLCKPPHSVAGCSVAEYGNAQAELPPPELSVRHGLGNGLFGPGE